MPKQKRNTADRPPMTGDDAKAFSRFSIVNASILATAAVERGCQCQPYEDWFTFNRWIAQGFGVKKGEHGTRISTYVETVDEKTGEARSFPHTSVVFCRCQVTEIKEKA